MTAKVPNSADALQNATEARVEPARLFTELYEKYFDFVWRSVRMMGAAPDVADDVVQNVFLVAHRRLADFEARDSPRTWLFAIALRVMSDQRRGARRRLRLLERARSVQTEPPTTPFDRVLRAEHRQALTETLESLTEEQRAVFVLADVEDMSAPEIASALGVNLNTVYSRLRTTRRLVAQRLQKLSRGD